MANISKIKVGNTSYGITATPTAHASTATTYGAASASNYGHVKLSDNYTSSAGAAASGIGASSLAVYNAYNTLNSNLAKHPYLYHQELPLSKFGTSGTSFTVYADNFGYGNKGHFTPTASEMIPISNTANLFVRKCVVYISNSGFISYGGVFSAYSKDIIITKLFNSDGTYVYRFANQGGSDAEVNFNVCQSLSYGNGSAIPVISGVKIHYQGLSSALCLKITIDKDLTNVDTSKFVVGLIIL